MMKPRFPIHFWPPIALASPIILPWILREKKRFQKGKEEAKIRNNLRIRQAQAFDLPNVTSIELTVLVEEKVRQGFLGESGVSYMIRTDQGAVLMDLGHGMEKPAFVANALQLDISMHDVDALLISHPHHDHMGGLEAAKTGRIIVPIEFLRGAKGKPCYITIAAQSDQVEIYWVVGPQCVKAGLATTGPLERMLFGLGTIEEQSFFANLDGKGLVVFVGCGHPTIEVILEMVKKLSSKPLYALCGGLHFPITSSRSTLAGLPIQQIAATGKPIWASVNDEDLTETIEVLNRNGLKKLLISSHDSCDHAIERLNRDLEGEVKTLEAGETYNL